MNLLLKQLSIGNINPLKEAVKALDEEINGLNALELSVLIKRAEKFLGAVRKRLLLKANETFLMLQQNEPKTSSWTLVYGMGTVYKYTPRTTWEYPDYVTAIETELHQKQREAKANGDAKQITPEVYPDTSPLFAINLADKFDRYDDK